MGIKIALAGNPNCGKTTMFNALTGSNQYVGNWPGVTVEKKEGHLKYKKGEEVIVTDLPGIYSLSPYTLEEVVSRDYILKENPDVIIDLVDATNIERNLYLTTQLIETGVPVVIALNMSDLLEKRGIQVDTDRLSMLLGCKVIKTSALKETGLKEVVDEAIKEAKKTDHKLPEAMFSSDVESAISSVKTLLTDISDYEKRWYAIKLLERDEKVIAEVKLSAEDAKTVENTAKAIEEKLDNDTESIFTDERYNYIQKIVSTTVKKREEKLTVSDKIDRIVTNRILGIPIFIAIMWFVYYVSVTTVGTFVTDWTNDVFVVSIQDFLTGVLTSLGASELLIQLIVDGIVGGVGAVVGFAPQMVILFFFLSILEDCGYMVRIAFVMDRVFRHFGLSGKSFIPLLIGSGCGVPGIMASKTIEQDNDRRLTIMTTTFIPCGAKLPVIALLGGIICGRITGDYESAGFIAPLMYFAGIAAVLISAIILKKTKPFSGKPAPFVMELPAYHIPSLKTILMHVWERTKAFLIKAGTILVVACFVIWALSTFGFEGGSFGIVEDINNSLLASIGGFISPLFAPLGFGEWQPVAASLSGFAAKEDIVTTMGVLANLGDEIEGTATDAMIIAEWFPTAAAALSFLIFNLLDSPCLAAISTMAEELKDRKWFWGALLFQNAFAYIITFIVYQFALLFMDHQAFSTGTAIAVIILIVLLYFLFRPDPYKDKKTYSKRSVEA
ncbi:MAG: ferrous iron transport protein B [Bulleidia sp.]|nr:ferrous iron transport protein B [Erysipelotrichaceae bacterium]MDY2780060.1 ferrous iron transport protein B [Bulleidia sp.]